MLCCLKSNFISCSSLRGYAGSQFLVAAADGASGGGGAGTSVLVVQVLLVVFFWWWLCSRFWRWGSCGQWSFSLYYLEFSLFCSCVCWPHPEGTTGALFWTWLMTCSASLELGWFHHWPLLDSFSQGGLYCNRRKSNAQMTDTMGEMRWTRPPDTLSIPQPVAIVMRRHDRKHIWTRIESNELTEGLNRKTKQVSHSMQLV